MYETISNALILLPKKKMQTLYDTKTQGFMRADPQKMINVCVVLLLPVLNNVWRLFPEELPYPYYEWFVVFVWTWSFHLSLVLLAAVWLLSIPRKDRILRTLAGVSFTYTVFMTLQCFLYTGDTSHWFDIVTAVLLSVILLRVLGYFQKKYFAPSKNYKALHDGIIHDIHHRSFLKNVHQLEDTLRTTRMDERYRSLLTDEIAQLKASVTRVDKQYETLS